MEDGTTEEEVTVIGPKTNLVSHISNNDSSVYCLPKAGKDEPEMISKPVKLSKVREESK